MKKHLLTSLISVSLLGMPAIASAKEVKVVSSLAPVHSLVEQVLNGTGENTLLIPTTQSPHGFQLRPSHMRQLKSADLVFWIGPGLEAFIDVPLLEGNSKSVELIEAPDIELLELREGGVWAAHDHGHDHDAHKDHEDHEKHDDHDHNEAHKDHDNHDHSEHAHKEDGHHDHDHDKHDHDSHKHEDEHDHHHDGNDPHIWLDADNAMAMLKEITKRLIAEYPEHAATFQKNADAALEKLEANHSARHDKLHDLDDRPFIVFHDAYQYFEASHHMKGVGSILLRPNDGASAKRLAEIRELIAQQGAVCVFREPQFPEKLVKTVIKGSDVKSGVLDPLGQGLEPGPALYDQLLDNLTDNLINCLQE
ncbi:MAG: zinc ABC transporter substrate-binding protein [Sneathiella sp.]|nr:zinc ABC transporter substrate-binding protein [Sneathiella sp.]